MNDLYDAGEYDSDFNAFLLDFLEDTDSHDSHGEIISENKQPNSNDFTIDTGYLDEKRGYVDSHSAELTETSCMMLVQSLIHNQFDFFKEYLKLPKETSVIDVLKHIVRLINSSWSTGRPDGLHKLEGQQVDDSNLSEAELLGIIRSALERNVVDIQFCNFVDTIQQSQMHCERSVCSISRSTARNPAIAMPSSKKRIRIDNPSLYYANIKRILRLPRRSSEEEILRVALGIVLDHPTDSGDLTHASKEELLEILKKIPEYHNFENDSDLLEALFWTISNRK